MTSQAALPNPIWSLTLLLLMNNIDKFILNTLNIKIYSVIDTMKTPYECILFSV